MRPLCAEIHEDDGVDPHEFFKKYRDRPRSDRKARQLCGQVAETLGQVLAGQADDVLCGLIVAAVEPAPDASRLLVTVRAPLPVEGAGPDEVLGRLERASGRLRAEVAAAITRRRTPTLAFRLAGPTGPGEDRP